MNYKIFKLLFLTCFGLVQVQAYDDFDPPTIIPKSVEGYYVYKKGMTAKIRYVWKDNLHSFLNWTLTVKHKQIDHMRFYVFTKKKLESSQNVFHSEVS